MKCKKTEKFLLRSLDIDLSKEERLGLEKHLKHCTGCQAKQREYQDIRDALRIKTFPTSKPHFWERLQSQLKQYSHYEPWPLWKRWGIRAIPLSIAIITVFALALVIFLPPEREQLSQSEILLRNQNPLLEDLPLLGEEEVVNPNIALIFTSLEEENNTRRRAP